jgi:hypothetical protein
MQVGRCSLSAMAFLLSEFVQYTTARCASHEELVSRLMNVGFEVGRRAIEVVSYRYAFAHLTATASPDNRSLSLWQCWQPHNRG